MNPTGGIALGINIDHVATLRQARGTSYPDPVEAAALAEAAGADSITVHLREDRRHIQERDVLLLRQAVKTRLNLEMAVADPMLEFALRVKPQDCCLVPERRQELTTEGGLDVRGQLPRLKDACGRLEAAGIRVAPFIDPEPEQIDACAEAGARVVELHTGAYADAPDPERQAQELQRLVIASRHAAKIGIVVHAGHGLHYQNVLPVASISEVVELNIGHSIIARAVMVGLPAAVTEMKRLLEGARP
ncbi:MAG TPA: pyridoxine 5'-phosphate synthase [Gammaproteobacteria bacterium]|jgi:pyridoxine 5-phosphate synthase|nr:pyridoxine 5'-phosphate synthase [Gammaproteobacteria bacterium]